MTGNAVAVFLRSGDIAIIDTDLGQIDILQGVPHIPRYDEIVEESEVATIDGVDYRVCSLRHLVKMKVAAGRPQDVDDLQALREAQPEFDWENGAAGAPGGGQPDSGDRDR